MNILIIGAGGREHALAWKAAQSPLAQRVYVAPGNAGTAREPGVENVAIDALDIDGLLRFAREHDVGLTIVGPEAPLVAGVVDAFSKAGLRCFGATRAAAQLEGSKAYAKDFLARHGIPTAAYAVFTDAADAKGWIREHGGPLVVKADGLAAGKGVIIAREESEAIAAVEDMLEGNAFGDAGNRVVIEEFLEGEEASFIVMSDGTGILPMASSQDHKARDDGDAGPNTGGMGAYSPAPVVDAAMHARVMREVIEPTVRGMAEDGIPYSGFLYAGLMIGKDGVPRVLEFNCRFGDPETQPIMMRLRSDLVELCLAGVDGRLSGIEAEWDERPALGVVLAAGGYPADYRKGDAITGLDEAATIPDSKVFHAGTASRDGGIVTAGGRVLCVCGLGATVSAAQRKAYEAASLIHWPALHYRHDIGYRAIAREKSKGSDPLDFPEPHRRTKPVQKNNQRGQTPLISPWKLREARSCIEDGGIVAYPTEAVYGLGCDPFERKAVLRLLQLKQRPLEAGLILIGARFEHVEPFIGEVAATALKRAQASWPGPHTWLLPASKLVPAWIRGAHDTVALRVTAHPVAAALCDAVGGALVSTSANRHGQRAARSLLDLHLRFAIGWESDVDFVLPGSVGPLARATPITDAASGRTVRPG